MNRGIRIDTKTQVNVNAPLDPTLLWTTTEWDVITKRVRGIQARIVKAVKAGEWRKVRNLQRLLTKSLAAKLLAVKRVTENSGKKTAGVDGALWLTEVSKGRATLSLCKQGYKAKPLKRVYIPKKNGKKRPLGIPTMHDRAMQALYKQALEPVAETMADKSSYGFRPKRCTADAIGHCHAALSQSFRAQWILEADIGGCFDNIHHEWLLRHIPMDRKILRIWLKAGYIEEGKLKPTYSGTPQGGIISPILANMTLDGLAIELKKQFSCNSWRANKNKVNLIRYADDFIITGNSKELLKNEVKPLVENFLAERGLRLSKEKTNIIHIKDGFDFLGQNVRKYGKDNKLLIKPSVKSRKSFKARIQEIMRQLKTAPQHKVIEALNPIMVGWGNYHRHVVSKAIFAKLDQWLWERLWHWSLSRHPNKGKRWVAKKYFHSIGSRNWVFACKSRPKAKKQWTVLASLAKIPIKRHSKIHGAANPYDPIWNNYLAQREKLQSVHAKCYSRANAWCLL